MKKQFLECGKIVATQGIKGEIRVQPWCDAPEFLLDFDTLFMGTAHEIITIEKAHTHKNIVIMKLDGIDTVEDANALRGKVLYVDRADVPLEDGECFVQDLLDCEVFDVDTGVSYGKIYEVRPTGANDVYYLRDEVGKERLVPVIPQVVLERDIAARVIKIRPLEGLFDD